MAAWGRGAARRLARIDGYYKSSGRSSRNWKGLLSVELLEAPFQGRPVHARFFARATSSSNESSRVRSRQGFGGIRINYLGCRGLSDSTATLGAAVESVNVSQPETRGPSTATTDAKECCHAAHAECVQPDDVGSDPEAEAKAAAQRKCISLLMKKDLSAAELEECLQAVESGYPANDPKLGTIYLRLGQMYDLHGASTDQIFLCGERALKVYEEGTMESGMCLHLLASAHHKNGEHQECIDKLKSVVEVIQRNGKDDSALKFAADFLLGDALAALGKYEEAIPNYLSGIAIQEKLVDKNHPQLGDNYRRVAEALAQLVRLPEAVEFCQKAVKVHQQNFGDGSLTEAADRRLLAIIYKGMEDRAKAVEQNKVVRNILMRHDRVEEARLINIGIAVCQIGLKQYDDAISTLNSLIAEVEDDALVKGLAHVNLSKVCFLKGKTEEAVPHSEAALKILKKNKSETMVVAEGFAELASVFETMQDLDTSLELLKESLNIYLAIPGQLNAVAGIQAQIGMVLYVLKEYEEALSYMQRSAKILEDGLGEEHYTLGCVLNQMGVTNMELKNLVLAADQFEKAKRIFMKVYGPGNNDTLAIDHNLVVVYSSLCRWDKAIKCQSEIIHELEQQQANPERLNDEREVMKELEHARVTRSL